MAYLPIPKNAPDIGECIYCGNTEGNLQKEHALPYGLNGPWTLLRASCADCADITHRLERDTLRGLFPAVRAVLAMQTRHSKNKVGSLPLVLKSREETRTVEVPLAEYPLYLPTPIFPPPGAVTGRTSTHGLPTEIKFIHLSGPSFEEVVQRHGVDAIGARLNFAPDYFARTIAKIAFGAAVFALGIPPLRNAPIRSSILGKDTNIGHWVGTWTGDLVNEASGLHCMQIRTTGSDVHVILRLFSQFGAPEYHVVLGPADPAYVNSEAWPWK